MAKQIQLTKNDEYLGDDRPNIHEVAVKKSSIYSKLSGHNEHYNVMLSKVLQIFCFLQIFFFAIVSAQ